MRSTWPAYLLSYDAVIEDASVRKHTSLEILKYDIRRARSGKEPQQALQNDIIAARVGQLPVQGINPRPPW